MTGAAIGICFGSRSGKWPAARARGSPRRTRQSRCRRRVHSKGPAAAVPGMTALSTAGVPSGLTSCFESVGQKPSHGRAEPNADDVRVHALAVNVHRSLAGGGGLVRLNSMRQISLRGKIRKPACLKWWSVVNASRSLNSCMTTKLVQSVNENSLSVWRKNMARAFSALSRPMNSQRSAKLSSSWRHHVSVSAKPTEPGAV